MDENLLPTDLLKGLPRGGCRPMFLLVKDAVLISRVFGANAPELEQLVADAVPQG